MNRLSRMEWRNAADWWRDHCPMLPALAAVSVRIGRCSRPVPPRMLADAATMRDIVARSLRVYLHGADWSNAAALWRRVRSIVAWARMSETMLRAGGRPIGGIF